MKKFFIYSSTIAFLLAFQKVSLGAEFEKCLYSSSNYDVYEPSIDGEKLTIVTSMTNSKERTIIKLKEMAEIKHDNIIPLHNKSRHAYKTVVAAFEYIEISTVSSFYDKNPDEAALTRVFLQFISAMLEFDKKEYDPDYFVPGLTNEEKNPKIIITAWMKIDKFEGKNSSNKENFQTWKIPYNSVYNPKSYTVSQNNASSALTFAFALFSGADTNELLLPLIELDNNLWTSDQAEKVKTKSPKVFKYLKKHLSLAVDSDDRHNLYQIQEWFKEHLDSLSN